jgi:hypothetical protein
MALIRAFAAIVAFSITIVLFLVVPLALVGVACIGLWWFGRLTSPSKPARRGVAPAASAPATGPGALDAREAFHFGGDARGRDR